MTLREIIAELQSIEYQLFSALDGNSTLQGASSDLNILLDTLEKQEINSFGGDSGVDADYVIDENN
jgi:hypothetical protein